MKGRREERGGRERREEREGEGGEEYKFAEGGRVGQREEDAPGRDHHLAACK